MYVVFKLQINMGNPSIPALRLYYFIESRHGRIKFGNSVNMSHQI